ncbi:MAG: DUF1538 domain-containing protein [Eubacteriales bacterium]|nr:DUF1538 domain-containing protein [Eubacteriales bacterium]
MKNKTIIFEKIKESVSSVLPITLIIIILCFTMVPISSGLMLSFLIGALMLITGMGLFTLGVDNALTPLGNNIGAWMMKTKKLGVILFVSFLIGVAITVSEPDLQVLAASAPHINSVVLIMAVALGVGFFLLIAMLHVVLGIKLKWLLLAFYAAVFALAAFSESQFLGIAFDSGGVTTGPMTVPFILALGVGVASLRNDESSTADSFGMVSLCSVGPIIAVLILGFVYKSETQTVFNTIPSFHNTIILSGSYISAIPIYIKEVALALSPIALFSILFNLFIQETGRDEFFRISVGILYSYIGLVLFLTGVNVGFSPMGAELGSALAGGSFYTILLPVAMFMGWFTVSAEPAVQVLNKQVEDISSGIVSSKAMGMALSISVACAMGLAMIRILTGLSIFWFIIPGYAISLILMFFVPEIFTSIAFDSGGVASGPMTATFMLPFAIGVSKAVGGNVVSDAFGLVALVAMMPLITIQIMGVIYKIRLAAEKKITGTEVVEGYEVIELWD